MTSYHEGKMIGSGRKIPVLHGTNSGYETVEDRLLFVKTLIYKFELLGGINVSLENDINKNA